MITRGGNVLKKGTLYWITGLSGAGKTTIGNALYYELKKKQDNLVILDGDILKGLIGGTLGYSSEDRRKRAGYYSNICKTLTDQGITVVICTIAMYDSIREWNRINIENYVEIFLKVDRSILIQRDRKGLYSGQAKGMLKNVAGIDQSIEYPKDPDIVIENDGKKTVDECIQKIMQYKVRTHDSFNRDVVYWNQFYKEKANMLQEPSDFAKYVFKYLEPGKKMMEIGCGNGRDSLFFARNGIDVVGVDASDEAIKFLNEQNVSNALFVCDDFVTCKSLYQMQYDYFYSRWTIHAINEKQEKELLDNITASIKRGGYFFIEVRSIHDYLYGKGTKIGKNSFEFNDHFRRFIDKRELEEKIVRLGFNIRYSEENTNFSKTEQSNPTLIRLVAEKK